jgi:hypothetical protein
VRFDGWYNKFREEYVGGEGINYLHKKLDDFIPLEVVDMSPISVENNWRAYDNEVAEEWCRTNCAGKWVICLWHGFFELGDDALRFKLAFG